jgi:hypothetical protein
MAKQPCKDSDVVAAFPVRVFISYAHDDAGHMAAVRQLWQLLRQMGFDATLDVVSDGPGQDWPSWAESQIESADFVVVVASARYRASAAARTEPDSGRGVWWEARLIREMIYKDSGKESLKRILPVVLPGHSQEELPGFLTPYGGKSYVIREMSTEGMAKLVRVLDRVPEIEAQESWRVRIRDVGGMVLGAGILLNADHVLTCARVVMAARDYRAGADRAVPAVYVDIEPVYRSDLPSVRASVTDGSWAPPVDDERDDLAVLKLDRPLADVPEAPLRRLPLSPGLAVHMCGFPSDAEIGVWVRARLADERQGPGRWAWNITARPGTQLRRGLGGAGVVDDATGYVVGMVVGQQDGGSANPWIMATDAILKRFPQVSELVDKAESRRRIDQLSATIKDVGAAEREAAQLHDHVASRVATTLELSFEWATLRDRLSAIRVAAVGASSGRVLATIESCDRAARLALQRAENEQLRLTKLLSRRNELRGLLDAYKATAAEHGLAENTELDALYRHARELLWTGPCNLPACSEAVDRYAGAVRRMLGDVGDAEV